MPITVDPEAHNVVGALGVRSAPHVEGARIKIDFDREQTAPRR